MGEGEGEKLGILRKEQLKPLFSCVKTAESSPMISSLLRDLGRSVDNLNPTSIGRSWEVWTG